MQAYLNFLSKNSGTFTEYTRNQLELILIVMVIALVVWVPTGIFISQRRSLAPKIMSLANVLYCIPSLSLFVVFVTIPGLGIGRKSAVLALVLYAMMPMVRNVYQGLIGVDRNVIEAAKGMGMNRWQIIKEILIPLAMPVMFAGFRVTMVMTASIATIAVYTGEKNLGRFIINGLGRANVQMIVVGGVAVCILTVLLDAVLAQLEKVVIPKGLRVQRH